MAVSRRKRFIRNPDRVDEIVRKAMLKLCEQKGESEFRAGISEIVDAMEKRGGAPIPSRASTYRALERLEGAGFLKITRRGERGNYTYKLREKTPASSVTATSQTSSETYAPSEATTVVPSTTVPTGDISAILTEMENLDAQIESRKATLLARLEEKKATLAALEAHLQSVPSGVPSREMVAA